MMPFLPCQPLKKEKKCFSRRAWTRRGKSFKCIISAKSSKHSHSSLWQKYSRRVKIGRVRAEKRKSGKESEENGFELWMRGTLMGSRPFFIITHFEVPSRSPAFLILSTPFSLSSSPIIKFYVSTSFRGDALLLYLLAMGSSQKRPIFRAPFRCSLFGQGREHKKSIEH